MTATERKRLVEKIRALFALSSNNPSREEAEAAMLKARQLMLQYGLSELEVGRDENGGTGDDMVGDKAVWLGSRGVPVWKLMLLTVVSDFFEVDQYLMRPRPRSQRCEAAAVFFGHSINSELAAHAAASLMSQIDALAARYIVDPTLAEQNVAEGWFGSEAAYARAAKREYREGLVCGLQRVLVKQKDAEQRSAQRAGITALALHNEELQRQYLERLDIKLRPPRKTRDSQVTLDGHINRGFRDAGELQLRKGLKQER